MTDGKTAAATDAADLQAVREKFLASQGKFRDIAETAARKAGARLADVRAYVPAAETALQAQLPGSEHPDEHLSAVGLAARAEQYGTALAALEASMRQGLIEAANGRYISADDRDSYLQELELAPLQRVVVGTISGLEVTAPAGTTAAQLTDSITGSLQEVFGEAVTVKSVRVQVQERVI